MNNVNRNDEALFAWNQWKLICSIAGCPDASRQILEAEVTNAFRKKFHRVVGNQLDQLFSDYDATNSKKEDTENLDDSPCQSGEGADQDFVDLPNEEDDDLDKEGSVSDKSNGSQAPAVVWAHEFDCGIIEKANIGKSQKNYKDHTWECIKNSSDPALKVIRGQLLGRCGIINEIAERFLRNNFPQIWEKQISIHMGIGRDDTGKSRTLGDVLPDKERSSLNSFDKECLTDHFSHAFSNDNSAILLVYLAKISLSIPELKNYVGLSNTTIYDRLNNVILPAIKAFPEECLRILFIPGATSFVISLLMNRIKPEKKSAFLLQRIENGMNRVNKRGDL